MNVRDLLDLRVICETGSLRKAAEVLGVTQPTLGNRLTRLEAQLGAPLFDRSRGRSQPTDLALYISNRAGTLAGAARDLAREAVRLATGKVGVVRIGVGQVALRVLQEDTVAPIEEGHEGCSVELVTGHTAQLTESLVRRELDIVVSATADIGPDVVDSELLLDAPIIVVAHPDHPLCAKPPADIHELFRFPFAVTVLEEHYRDLLRGLGVDFENLEGRLVCSDVGLLVRAVARRPRYFSAGPGFLYATEVEAGRLRIVDFAPPFRHRIYLHSNHDAYPLPAVAQMKEFIRRVFERARTPEAAIAATASRPR